MAAPGRKRFWDVHAHPQESPIALKSIEEIFSKHHLDIQRISVMGTQPNDWDKVETLAQRFPDRIIPCFGLHPWFAYKLERMKEYQVDNWLDKLESLIVKYPNAIVGELGLDSIAKTPHDELEKYSHLSLCTFDTVQKKAFEDQFNIAIKLSRPVSVHNVHAHGYFYDFLKRRAEICPSKRRMREDPESVSIINSLFPPAIMLHSYSGSVDMLKQLLKIPHVGNRIYFSFSELVNARYLRTPDLILACPDDRILAESDAGEPERIPQNMNNIIETIKNVKRWNEDEIDILWNNSERFHSTGIIKPV